jgi:hypothetical protein
MTTTDKTYITLSIKKHVPIDVERALLLEELSKISDSDTSTLVKFMGRVNSITSGAFKEADEFSDDGISDPQVLAQFTPGSTAVLQQIKNGNNTANINVNVAIGGTDPTGTNGLFTLDTINKNSIIEAINEIYNSVNSAFTTAGAGLTSSSTTVSVGAGNGITVNTDNVAIDFTGVSTDGSTTPTSLAQVIGTTALQTTDKTVIGGINDVRADAYSFFTQKMPVTNAFCISSEANAQTLLDIFCVPFPSCDSGSFISFHVTHVLVEGINSVIINCLNMLAAVSTGTPQDNTVFGPSATFADCKTTFLETAGFTTTSASDLKTILTGTSAGNYLKDIIATEIC